MRQSPGEKTRPLRGIHRLLRLSKMQVHAPDHHGIKCPKCNEGEFVRRGSAGKGGRGRPRVFYGCSRYTDCDFTSPHMPIAEPCPSAARRSLLKNAPRSAPCTPASKRAVIGRSLCLKHSRKRNRRRLRSPWRQVLSNLHLKKKFAISLSAELQVAYTVCGPLSGRRSSE